MAEYQRDMTNTKVWLTFPTSVLPLPRTEPSKEQKQNRPNHVLAAVGLNSSFKILTSSSRKFHRKNSNSHRPIVSRSINPISPSSKYSRVLAMMSQRGQNKADDDSLYGGTLSIKARNTVVPQFVRIEVKSCLQIGEMPVLVATLACRCWL